MKAFYIGKFWPRYRTEFYVQHALAQKGVEVVRRQLSAGVTLEDMKSQIRKHKVDFVLFSKSEAPYFQDLVRWCKAEGYLTVCWLWDLYWGYRSHKPSQFRSDLLFTTDGGHDSYWTNENMNHEVLRQGIHKPEHKWFDPAPEIDVAFIGSMTSNPPRRRLCKYLRTHLRDRLAFFQNVRGIDLNRLLAKVKVVVGDSYPCKNYWSNRIYEITGRGGFLLHPVTEGLDAEYTDGEHYVSYKRVCGTNLKARHELLDKIEYYLHNDEEREAIRRAGFEHTGAYYTYEHRVETLLQRVDAGRGWRSAKGVTV